MFGLFFKDAITPVMFGITSLFDEICQYLLFISLGVTFAIFYSIKYGRLQYAKDFELSLIDKDQYDLGYLRVFFILFPIVIYGKIRSFFYYKLTLHRIVANENLETVWTIIPCFILLLIAIPSFMLLYAMDEVFSPLVVLKITGSQWYWNYSLNYSNLYTRIETFVSFDSYLIDESNLFYGDSRLLETTDLIAVPVNTNIVLLVTSSDVIHSWSLPAAGIKVDAVPGRLNLANLYIERHGVFHGQCSEICGVNHGYMPITLASLSFDRFNLYYTSRRK